jgi:hypothetical protein
MANAAHKCHKLLTILVVCWASFVQATAATEASTTHDDAFVPSLDYQNRLARLEPDYRGTVVPDTMASDVFEHFVKELDAAKKANKDLGKYENERQLFSELLMVSKLDGQRCPSVLDDINRLRRRCEVYKPKSAALRDYLDRFARRQREFCKKFKKNLHRQDRLLRKSRELKDGLAVWSCREGSEIERNDVIRAISKVLSELERARLDYGGRLLPEYAPYEALAKQSLKLIKPGEIGCGQVFEQIERARNERPCWRKYLEYSREVQMEHCRRLEEESQIRASDQQALEAPPKHLAITQAHPNAEVVARYAERSAIVPTTSSS